MPYGLPRIVHRLPVASNRTRNYRPVSDFLQPWQEIYETLYAGEVRKPYRKPRNTPDFLYRAPKAAKYDYDIPELEGYKRRGIPKPWGTDEGEKPARRPSTVVPSYKELPRPRPGGYPTPNPDNLPRPTPVLPEPELVVPTQGGGYPDPVYPTPPPDIFEEIGRDQFPSLPDCSDDIYQQTLYNVPPCSRSRAEIQVTFP